MKSLCPSCGGATVSTSHGFYCPKYSCKWGWETEMDGSSLKPPFNPPRFRLIQDNDSHWYAIPAGRREDFIEWAEREDGSPEFDKYRLNMHPSNYTFTDLKEDK